MCKKTCVEGLDKSVDVCYTSSNKEVVNNVVREVSKMLKKACRIVGNTVLVGCGLFSAWLVASWIDVVMHNLNPEPVYHSWNLFVLMVSSI